MFSSKNGGLFGKGGIFGSKGFGFNSGTISAAGMGAGLLGSLIGGTTGSVLMGAASGIGAASSLASILGISSIGGPVGLAIGAAIGGGVALISALFGKSKQRKKDEKTRTAAYVNAIAELDKIRTSLERRPPGMNWETGINNAKQIQTDYYQQVNALKDKKTRNIALKTGREAIDPRVSQVEAAAAAARVYEYNRGQTAKDFVGEFANGNYFGKKYRDNQIFDMMRNLDMRRGYIAGGLPGKDRHFGMFADDEAILNRRHMNNINAVAGFDVLAHAGIPNYPVKARPIKNYAEGNYFNSGANLTAPNFTASSQPMVTNIFNVSVGSGATVTAEEIKDAVLGAIETPEGRKKIGNLAVKATKNYVNTNGRTG